MDTTLPRPVIAIVGPTATGKSELGVRLAQHLGGEVVNCDASQLYRGMDVGTAKLTVEERGGVAHHQLDVLEVTDEASVASYQSAARADIEAIASRGAVPIVVGGSGLYARAALDKLEIPPTDPTVRAALEARLESEGTAILYGELQAKDPNAADNILPSNARRIVRALEVIALTGRPFSATMPTREFLRGTVMIGLGATRTELDERVTARVRRMWERGLLEEVRALQEQGLREGRTASRAIGYAQALAELDGNLSTHEAQLQTATATRRLIRRQESWFRPDPRIQWLPANAPDLLQRALRILADHAAPPGGVGDGCPPSH